MKFSISETNNGERLDIFLSKKIKGLTRSFIKKIINKKEVKINNIITCSPSKKLKLNDIVLINVVEKTENKLKPKKIKLEVSYEDEDLLIINKQKGMVVHPGAGNYENTLANALAYKYKNNLSNINGKLRPGIVHRIDKETSGLLVIAKNNFTHSQLSKQFIDHSIRRKYICLIWGVIRPLNGRIQTLISRNRKNRQLMTVSDIRGKKATTNYRTIKVFTNKDIPKISLIECELETGRTHQIRVHMNYKGNSVLGDDKYKKKYKKLKNIDLDLQNSISKLKRQFLHAKTLGFTHPSTKKPMTFSSLLPKDLSNILKKLRNTEK